MIADNVAEEYWRISNFLGMKKEELSLDIAKISDMVQQFSERNLVNGLDQLFPLVICYLIGRGKLIDKYKKEIDDYVITDFAYLVTDYLEFTYGIQLK